MKILIVKTSALGDIVHAFPVASYLRTRFPDATIDWVSEAANASLPIAHPAVNRVHSIYSKRWRQNLFSRSTWQELGQLRQALHATPYDVVFDLQGNSKSGVVTGLALSKHKVGFSRGAVAEWPNLLFTNTRFTPPPGQNIRNDYLFLVQRFFNDSTPYNFPGVNLIIDDTQRAVVQSIIHQIDYPHLPTVLVCPGSAWTNKRLPTPALQDLLLQLQAELPCNYLFAWGTEEEKQDATQLANSLNHSSVIPRLPLPTLQNLMQAIDLVIAMDSVPLHLAGTTTTPVLGLFGPSSALKYHPCNANSLALQGACPYGHQFVKRCSQLRTCATGGCLRQHSGQKLFEACHNLLIDGLMGTKRQSPLIKTLPID
jgi:heptosyltransferase-1